METREWECQISREEYISRVVERAMNPCEDSNNALETLEQRIVVRDNYYEIWRIILNILLANEWVLNSE